MTTIPKKDRKDQASKENLKIKKKGNGDHQDDTTSSTPRRALRNLFSCKHNNEAIDGRKKKNRRINCSGSLCSVKNNPEMTTAASPAPLEVQKKSKASVTGNNSSCSSRRLQKNLPLSEINGVGCSNLAASQSSDSLGAVCSSSASSNSVSGSFRGMHLRRLSGCYECNMVVDPISGVLRVPSLRATICPCPDCGEVFMKSEILELHQAVRHAVSELGPEDTSRNIVEIIFQSSWMNKQSQVCKIDRILKVHNTPKTISRFEDYREMIKGKAKMLAKKHPRCVADGNELLRFYCTSMRCSLGLNGSNNLCDSIPHCGVCSIIRDGLKTDEQGKIRSMATSGRAHDTAKISTDGEKRAMLVCRVIAGRVKKNIEAAEDCDSVAGAAGLYSNLDELFVFNPKAILPCFVVIYRGF